jgi:hypothetical protein
VHGRTGVLQKPGEFPAGREGEFLLADEAKRFYKSGPPFLRRYLPFWIANFIERTAVLLLPLVALILPLIGHKVRGVSTQGELVALMECIIGEDGALAWQPKKVFFTND